MRICKECSIEKDINKFYLKKDGKVKSSYCKDCYNIIYKHKYDKNERKIYYQNNKEHLKLKHKKWVIDNKESREEYIKKWREENKEHIKLERKNYAAENPEVILKGRKKWIEKSKLPENKERRNNRQRELYRENIEKNREIKRNYINLKMEDPLFKLKFNIRTLIRNSLKRGFTKKSKKTIEILGCSFEEFYNHLESRFDEKMSWENQGTYWHIDHIKPISLATTEEEVYELNHYTNFQPLYWEDNLKKSNNY